MDPGPKILNIVSQIIMLTSFGWWSQGPGPGIRILFHKFVKQISNVSFSLLAFCLQENKIKKHV